MGNRSHASHHMISRGVASHDLAALRYSTHAGSKACMDKATAPALIPRTHQCPFLLSTFPGVSAPNVGETPATLHMEGPEDNSLWTAVLFYYVNPRG